MERPLPFAECLLHWAVYILQQEQQISIRWKSAEKSRNEMDRN